MDTVYFNEVLNARLKKIKEVLGSKAIEYATDDRMHNFHVAARIANTTREKALFGMMLKHIVSVLDLIEGRNVTPGSINEKIGDTINYLILLEAMLIEGCGGEHGVLYRD